MYEGAPTPVTAFMAAATKAAALVVTLRVLTVAFPEQGELWTVAVAVTAIASLAVGHLAALAQRDLKRMLAYSSVAQIGYITLGIGLANQAGLTGGLVHIANHALMKAALFLAVGAIFYRAGTVQLKELAGIGRKMPLTMAAFTIAGLGLVGTPGTSGFISKWYLALGALDKNWWVLVFLIVGSSLIALVYIGRALEVAWLREPSAEIAHATDPPLSMLIPLVVLAAATIYFGIETEWTAGIANTAAKALIGGLR